MAGVVAFLGARRFGAGFADGFERDARGFVGFGEIGLGRGQPIRGGAALAAGALDLADQRLALTGEFFRRVDQFGAFGWSLLACAASSVAIWAAAPSLRSFQACRSPPIACRR